MFVGDLMVRGPCGFGSRELLRGEVSKLGLGGGWKEGPLLCRGLEKTSLFRTSFLVRSS